VRALYVVTDTATYGLSDASLRKAVRRIREQLSMRDPVSADQPGTQPTKPQVALLAFPSCPEPSGSTLVVFGPNFSGAFDSIGEQSTDIVKGPITGICLISGAATNPSNQFVQEPYSHVTYVPLALDDWRKLAHVAGLTRQLLGPKDSGSRDFKDVTILAEASTFGFGLCDRSVDPNGNRLITDPQVQAAEQLCHDARMVYFPASIADLRDEVQHQKDEARRDARNPLHIDLPDDSAAAADASRKWQ